MLRQGVLGHMDEFYAVHGGNLGGAGVGIILAIINGAYAVGAEGLHARGAGHGGAGYYLGFAALEEAAEVNFCMEHEFLAFGARCPKAFGRGKAGEESVVGRANDAVILIEGGGAYLAVGILGAQGGHVGQAHDILGNRKTAHGIILQQFCVIASAMRCRSDFFACQGRGALL